MPLGTLAGRQSSSAQGDEQSFRAVNLSRLDLERDGLIWLRCNLASKEDISEAWSRGERECTPKGTAMRDLTPRRAAQTTT